MATFEEKFHSVMNAEKEASEGLPFSAYITRVSGCSVHVIDLVPRFICDLFGFPLGKISTLVGPSQEFH